MFFFLLDSTEGYIKSASNEVLGVLDGKKDAGNKVLLELVNESMEDAQMWVRDKEASSGWFTLRHKASGKCLTAKNDTTLTIEGNYDYSTLHLKFPRLLCILLRRLQHSSSAALAFCTFNQSQCKSWLRCIVIG